MLERVLDWIDALDLTRLHGLLAFMGALLAVYVMALTSHEQEDHDDPLLIQWLNRGAYALVACGFLSSLSYSIAKKWEPWPPEILLMLAVIAIMSARAAVIHLRIRRTGHRARIADLVAQQRRLPLD